MTLTAGLAGTGLTLPGVQARGELGWKPTENQSLFAFSEVKGQLGQPLGWQIGLGYRVTW